MMFSMDFFYDNFLGIFFEYFYFLCGIFIQNFPRDFLQILLREYFFHDFFYFSTAFDFIYFLHHFPRDFFTEFSAGIFFFPILNFVFTIFDFFLQILITYIFYRIFHGIFLQNFLWEYFFHDFWIFFYDFWFFLQILITYIFFYKIFCGNIFFTIFEFFFTIFEFFL